MPEYNTYYVSLTRGLINYYVKFEAPDESIVRRHAYEYFGRMWCSVYDEGYFIGHIKERFPNTRVVNDDKPIVLDTWEWE